jgi:hypothetical protein
MSKLFAMPGLDAKLLTCRSVALLTDQSIRGLAVGSCQETEGERDGEELRVLVEPRLLDHVFREEALLAARACLMGSSRRPLALMFLESSRTPNHQPR